MDAITFIGTIPNAKMFGSVTHSIYIYCVSITNLSRIYFISTLSFFLTKFSLRVGGIISITTFLHYFAGLLMKGFCLFCSAIPRG